MAYLYVAAVGTAFVCTLILTRICRRLRQRHYDIPARDISKGHRWIRTDMFHQPTYCNICETHIMDGAYCDSCGICVKNKYMKEANKSLPCKELSNMRDTPKHHFVKGNLPMGSSCEVCSESCGNLPSLCDFRCVWCSKTIHERCEQLMGKCCDLGPFRNCVIPPNCVRLKQVGIKGRRHFVVDSVKQPDIDNWKPLIVIANRKSGNNDGELILQAFRKILNPAQIIDLSEMPPECGLEWCHLLPHVTCRVLIAGGDGTIGWVLGAIDKLKLKVHDQHMFSDVEQPLLTTSRSNCTEGRKRRKYSRDEEYGKNSCWYINWNQQNYYMVETAQCEGMVEVEAARYEQTLPTPSPSIRPVKTAGTQRPAPQVCILPLGTGNDLSRVLGWGEGYTGDVDVTQILAKLERSKVVRLDRWKVEITPTKHFGFRMPKKTLIMNNYASVGVDALVTLNFHRHRESRPALFGSRLLNKFWYFTYGTKDVLERECKDLQKKIRVELDGRAVSLPEIEGLVVLNIASWGGGCRPWAIGNSNSRDDIPQANYDDGLVEVFALYSSFHIAQLQVGLAEPLRLGQAKQVKITLQKGNAPMQVDGEPWEQHPATITITSHNTATMLANIEDTTSQ